MQALCSQCSQKIVIDDAKVPDRPFSVRCPKCQNVVKLPGKGAANGAAAPVGAPAQAPEPRGPDLSGSHSSEEMRAQMMAQLRREMAAGDPATGGQAALVAFPDPTQAAAITLTLTRLGFHVDTADNFDDGARLLEQGAYQLVATSRMVAAAGRPESLYQRMIRMSPDQRRRLFVILVGDEFKTGDGTQGFLVLGDLVLHSRDAGAADPLIRSTIAERRRLYQAFDEARKKFEQMGAA